MKYIFILVVIALIVGPVAWLRPSPADRRRERLRSRARHLGLQVNLCELPQTHRQQVRRERPEMGASYSLRDPERVLPSGRWLRDEGGEWQLPDGLPPLASDRDWLATLNSALPASVVALERGGVVISVFWREHGNETAVEAIAEVLGQLMQQGQRSTAD